MRRENANLPRHQPSAAVRSAIGKARVALLALAVAAVAFAATPQRTDAVVHGYKYAAMKRTGTNNYSGVYAEFTFSWPNIYDDADTHSIVQHWIGSLDSSFGTRDYFEVGYRTGAGGGAPQMFWGYHKNDVWQGYNWVGNPITCCTHKFKIVWNHTGAYWEIHVDDQVVATVPDDEVPGPLGEYPGAITQPTQIQTGGEITWGASPSWNEMGWSTTQNMIFKNPANPSWAWWDFTQNVDQMVVDSVTCRAPYGYYNQQGPSHARDVYGCENG